MSADRRALATLAAGHACADACQGAVPALVPFLIAERGLSYAQTGALVLAMSITSSFVQPLAGLWSDRRSSGWSAPAGVALGGAGIAALGAAGSFWAMAAATAASGLGVALFHPEGARRATVAAGARAGTGLSLFAVGGSAGWALGPVLVTPAVLLAGPSGTAVLLVPTLLVAAALLRLPAGEETSTSAVGDTGGDRPGAFLLLTAVACLRAGAYFGPQALLAAALVTRFDASAATGNAALTVFLVAGAAGNLTGGRLADRIGTRPVIIGSLVASVPALAATLASPSAALAVTAAGLLGFTVVAGYSPIVVLGQDLLGSRPTLAAGSTLGVAIGAGGLVAAALGPLADSAGPDSALWAVGGVAALGALLACGLPASGARRARA